MVPMGWNEALPRTATKRHAHASITPTGNVYMQIVDANVIRAVNSHAIAVLDGWTPEVESLGQNGRNIRKPLALTEKIQTSDRNLMKFDEALRKEICM